MRSGKMNIKERESMNLMELVKSRRSVRVDDLPEINVAVDTHERMQCS